MNAPRRRCAFMNVLVCFFIFLVPLIVEIYGDSIPLLFGAAPFYQKARRRSKTFFAKFLNRATGIIAVRRAGVILPDSGSVRELTLYCLPMRLCPETGSSRVFS